MKTPQKPNQFRGSLVQINRFVAIPIALVSLFILAGFNSTSMAANILTDPGFESLAQGTLFPGANGAWTVYGQTWGNSDIIATPPDTYQGTGTNSYKVFGGYNGSVNYNGAYQDNAAGPGDIYTADGWAYTLDSDTISGADTVWIEVTFRDTNSDILALYRSAMIGTNELVDGSFAADTWVDLPVTNQYDPGTYTVTNTVSSLVAPPGTAFVRYQILFQQGTDQGGGSMYFDDCNLDQTGGPLPPAVSNIIPDDGQALFNTTNTFSFDASSPDVSISADGIHLTLNGTDVTTNLIVSGAGTAKASVRYTNLVANRVYVGQIRVTDDNGLTVSAPVRFDTFSPTNFTWEAEDFDFSSGQFIDNPVLSTNSPDSYYNQVGASNVDEYVGNYDSTQPHDWRTNDLVSTASANDTARTQFTDAGMTDYSVGYFNPTNWVNYTRTFPAGDYIIYGRVANGNGGLANCYLDEVTSGAGTTAQTTRRLGAFQFTSRGWSSYDFVPLTDPWGNVVTVHLDGQATLRVTAGDLGGGVNLNFFMLAPARTDLPPAIADVYPDGAHPFETTNELTFTVRSSGSTVSTNDIQVTLNNADVSSELVFSGSATNWQVSLPLPNQGVCTSTIAVTDAKGRSQSYTVTFDNFSQTNLMIEAEDFDFNGGQFIENPVPGGNNSIGPDSYYYEPAAGGPYGTNAAIVGIDLTTPSNLGGETFDYRPYESCGTQPTMDWLRQKYVQAQQTDPSATDYNIGWWPAGTWLNYTRVFPTNTYVVYGRLAGGGPFSGTTLGVVTSGVGTSNQVTQTLGSFSNPNQEANGWQVWHWVPLLNANGQMAVLSLGGTNTIKLTSGDGLNANYYMFVAVPPVATPVSLNATANGSDLRLAFKTQSGFVYTVLYKNSLTDASWQTLKTVTGDGSIQIVTDSLSATQRFYRVSIATP